MRTQSRLALRGGASLAIVGRGCAPDACAPAPAGRRRRAIRTSCFRPRRRRWRARRWRARQQRGWQFLQAGDLGQAPARVQRGAEAETPAFYPADAGLGYASLADRDYADAIARFDRVLRRAAAYVPALVGKGDALLAPAGSTTPCASSPRLRSPSIRRWRTCGAALEVLALREPAGRAERRARRRPTPGGSTRRRPAYERAIAASPDSAFLYRELAAVERKAGRRGRGARAPARRPSRSTRRTRARCVQLGELLEERGDFAGAVTAYAKAAGDRARRRGAAERSRPRGPGRTSRGCRRSTGPSAARRR